MRVLIDLPNVREAAELVEWLKRRGYEIVHAGNDYDAVVVGTPEKVEALRRERPTVGIVAWTGKGGSAARIRALMAGADDAIDNTFPGPQLALRVESVVRRAAMTPPAAERIDIDGCTIDLSACTATRGDNVQALTAREVEIVRWLARYAGDVVDRGELLQRVWRVAAGTKTRAVDVAIAALRAKLERDAARPQIIISVRRIGYLWKK